MCCGNNSLVALNLTREPAESSKIPPFRVPMTPGENPQFWMKMGWSTHYMAGFRIRDRARFAGGEKGKKPLAFIIESSQTFPNASTVLAVMGEQW